MKRTTRKVEKRTFTLKNALPRFVSIVTRGANFTPLSELRFSDDNAKFSDVEINRIVFSKDIFTREAVAQYLQDNDYTDCEVFEDEAGSFVVPGVSEEQFEEVAPIEYGDGVQFFVGKLKQATDTNQAAVEVTDSVVLDFNEPEQAQVDPENESVETEALVQEGDLAVEDLQPKVQNEENETVDAEAHGEESTETKSEADAEVVQEGEPEAVETVQASEPETVTPEVDEPTENRVFNDRVFREKAEAALAVFMESLAAAQTESFSLPVDETVEVFTAEQVAEQVEAAVEQYKQSQIKENDENTLDENTIVVQNSQAVNSEEISNTVSRDTDENLKFSQRKSKDLFGLN